MLALNTALETMSVAAEEDLPAAAPVWVVGLPRSGTTLACQILVASLTLGYVNNFVARFWKAPLVGARLSRILGLTDVDRSWSSEFGKTRGLEGIHEFSYYWNQLLGYSGSGRFSPREAGLRVDWSRLQRSVSNLDRALGSPALFKLMAGAFYLERFMVLFPRSLVVHVERDAFDVACSLAQGRLHHHGDLDRWWSIYTDDYEELVQQPYWRQIPRQVIYYRGVLERGLAALPGDRVISVRYEDLCADPAALVDAVHDYYAHQEGLAVRRRGRTPDPFRATVPAIDDAVRARIRQGFEDAGERVPHEPGGPTAQ
jgi:LPS sulfotransferase NodH